MRVTTHPGCESAVPILPSGAELTSGREAAVGGQRHVRLREHQVRPPHRDLGILLAGPFSHSQHPVLSFLSSFCLSGFPSPGSPLPPGSAAKPRRDAVALAAGPCVIPAAFWYPPALLGCRRVFYYVPAALSEPLLWKTLPSASRCLRAGSPECSAAAPTHTSGANLPAKTKPGPSAPGIVR